MSDRVRLWSLLAPQGRWIALGVILSVLAVASNVLLMGAAAFLISRAAIVTNVAEVALAITGVRVLAISRAAFRYLERYVTHAATFRILTDLRVWFFRSIEPLAPARLSTMRSGDVLARIVADIEALDDLAPRVVVPILAAVLVTALAGLLLSLADATLGIVVVIGLLLAGVLVPVATRRWSGRLEAQFIATRAETHAMLVDEIQGLADLTAFDDAERHRHRTLELGAEVERIQMRLATIRATASASSALVTTLTGVAVLGIAVELVATGRLDGVLLAALPLAAIAAFEATQPLSASVQMLATGQAAAGRLFELVDVPAPVADPETPARRPDRHDLDIRGLRFRYDADGPFVLDGLDLRVAAGTSLAILGASGAGKSTLVNLLLRFWDYHDGEIRIGGRDLHAYAADDVRAMIGVASQRTHLFDATIRDNLALADPDISDAQVEAVCRQVQLHDFVQTLPQGYGTPIGEDGIQLSGGERQRLAIARAIIKDAPILILDEATANLDVPTERDLMDAIAPFMAGRTTVLISHRASMLAYADIAVTLDAGRARHRATMHAPDHRSRSLD